MNMHGINYYCGEVTIQILDLIISIGLFTHMFAEMKCPPVCPRGGAFGSTPLCPPSCFQYKGALDVFYKIIRQVHPI